jgi:hypothetical protein
VLQMMSGGGILGLWVLSAGQVMQYRMAVHERKARTHTHTYMEINMYMDICRAWKRDRTYRKIGNRHPLSGFTQDMWGRGDARRSILLHVGLWLLLSSRYSSESLF